MSTEIPPLKTRKPTGKPPWPLVLLAGVEKSGKSYSAAAFSASDLIDRTFWIEIGEGAADQYGAIPGARYEIVEHDGTYVGIGKAVRAATLQPRPNGKPHAIVVDSMTELWDMLSDEQQGIANQRRKRGANGEAPVTMDQWNAAKKRWKRIVEILRVYDGPVILTSRLELVAVMEGDRPTKDKALKVRTEKNLPFDVDAVVQITAPRRYELTGVRSVLLEMPKDGSLPMPDFTVDTLLRRLGLDQVGATAARSYTAPTADPEEALEDAAKMAAAEAASQSAPPPLREPKPAASRVQRGPQDDSAWQQPEQPDEARPSVQGQHIAISQLFAAKHGVTTRERKLAGVAHYLHHPVESTTELTYADAAELIQTLSKLPDYKPKPSPEEAQQASARAEAEALAATDEPDADRIEAAHRDAIESADSLSDVHKVIVAAEQDVAAGLIGTVVLGLLRQAADRRKDQLKADGPWTSGVSRQMDGAAA